MFDTNLENEQLAHLALTGHAPNTLVLTFEERANTRLPCRVRAFVDFVSKKLECDLDVLNMGDYYASLAIDERHAEKFEKFMGEDSFSHFKKQFGVRSAELQIKSPKP